MDENINLSWFGVTAVISGLLFFWLLKYGIEPWVIETVCRELISCDQV